MELQVKYKELDEVSKENINNSKLLNDKIDLLKENISFLQDNWQGEDADKFYESITPFLNDLKSIPVFYAEISSIINKMNGNYKDTDDEFLERLKKGVVIDEKYSNKE